jgi:hypothetical protein
MGTLIRLEARRRAAPALVSTDASVSVGDPEFFGVWLVLWVASVVRTALGFAHHEVFQTEATLALLCALLVPLLALNHWWRTRAPAGNRRPRDERHF